MNEKQCREAVKARSGGLCERCCCNTGITMHHRKKRSQGGKWTPDNIAALCGHGTVGCHGWVENHPNAAAEEGWHVRPWEDPAEIPALYRGSTWSYLTTDGRLTNVNSSQYPQDNDSPQGR